jgi:hypothetical protein
MGLVVFPVRPRAREGKALLCAVLNDMVVQELAAVIGIKTE